MAGRNSVELVLEDVGGEVAEGFGKFRFNVDAAETGGNDEAVQHVRDLFGQGCFEGFEGFVFRVGADGWHGSPLVLQVR